MPACWKGSSEFHEERTIAGSMTSKITIPKITPRCRGASLGGTAPTISESVRMMIARSAADPRTASQAESNLDAITVNALQVPDGWSRRHFGRLGSRYCRSAFRCRRIEVQEPGHGRSGIRPRRPAPLPCVAARAARNRLILTARGRQALRAARISRQRRASLHRVWWRYR
jgi:hypothetical protein